MSETNQPTSPFDATPGVMHMANQLVNMNDDERSTAVYQRQIELLTMIEASARNAREMLITANNMQRATASMSDLVSPPVGFDATAHTNGHGKRALPFVPPSQKQAAEQQTAHVMGLADVNRNATIRHGIDLFILWNAYAVANNSGKQRREGPDTGPKLVRE